MPGTKEIRAKIASVKSTQKITKAMQMVATSKMRRAQDRMRLARPYAEKIRAVIGNLTQANPDYRHPFLQERATSKNVGVIVDLSDRGLCGSLEHQHLQAALMRDARLAGQGRAAISHVPHRRQGHGVLPPPAESRSSRTRRASATSRTSRT